MTLDAPDRSAGPVAALRRRWWLAVVLAVAGLLWGLFAASLRSPLYSAEARVVVGSGAIAEYRVPGYAAASQQLAENYARYVGSQVALGRVSGFLGDVDGTVQDLISSPIPGSNVIRIEALSDDRDVARETAQAAAERLVEVVGEENSEAGAPDALLAEYTSASAEVGTAQATLQEARAELERALDAGAAVEALADVRQRVAAAVAAADVAGLRQDAIGASYRQVQAALAPGNGLSIVADAAVTGNDLRSRQERYALIGLAIGLALAVVGAPAPRGTAASSAAAVSRVSARSERLPLHVPLLLAAVVLNMFSGHAADVGAPVAPDRVCFAAGMLLLLVDERTWRRPGRRGTVVHPMMLALVLLAASSAWAYGTLFTATGQFALLDRLVVPFVLFAVAPVAFDTPARRLLLLKVLILMGLYLAATAVFEIVGPRQPGLPAVHR